MSITVEDLVKVLAAKAATAAAKPADDASTPAVSVKQDGAGIAAGATTVTPRTGPSYTGTDTSTTGISTDDKGLLARTSNEVKTANGSGLADTHSTGKAISVDSSGLNASASTSDKHESPGGSSEQTRTTTGGTGGIFRKREDKVTANPGGGRASEVASSSSEAGVNFGAGGLGPRLAFGQSAGKVAAPKNGEAKDAEDARFRDPGPGDPKPTSSRDVKATFGGGLVSGPDGNGIGGSQSSSVDSRHDDIGDSGSGIRSGVKEAADGSWTYTLTEDPGSSPPTFTMVVKIKANLTVGVSGGADHTADSGTGKGSTTVGLDGSAGAWTTRTYTGLKSDREVRQIEKNLAGAAGSLPASMGDSKAALDLPVGDSAETGAQYGYKASAGASGTSGSTSVGADGGYGDTRSIVVKTTHTSKNTVAVTVTPSETTSEGAGLSAGSGVAGWSGHTDSSHTKLEAYTFSLQLLDDKGQPIPGADALFQQICSARTKGQLDKILASRPDLLAAHVTGTDDVQTNTNKVNLGPVAGSLTSSAEQSHQVKDQNGSRTDVYDAKNDTGVKVSVAGRDVLDSDRGDDAHIEVDRRKNSASGSVGEHSSDSDLGRTLANAAAKPAQTIFGAATSGQVPLAKTAESTGLDFTDADIDRIIASANNARAWQEANANTDIQADWVRCREAVKKAGNDRNAVAAALADFVGKERSGRAQVVEHIIRPPGEATGGSRYDWPDGLANERSQYSALVLSDGLAAARQLAGAGRYDDAVAAAAHAESGLTHLADVLTNPPTPFADDAARAEMLAAVGKKRAEAEGFAARELALKAQSGRQQKREQKLTDAGVYGTDAGGEPVCENIVPDAQQQSVLDETAREAADDDAKVRATQARAEAKARLVGLTAALDVYLKQQDHDFGTADTEMNKKGLFSRPDPEVIVKCLNHLRNEVYPAWDNALKQAEKAATEAGEDPSAVGPRPAHDWLEHEFERFNSLFPNGGS